MCLLLLIKFDQVSFCVLVSLGRHYDKDGNLRDWWTPESNRGFMKLAKCMVDQYSSFIIDEENGIHVCCPCTANLSTFLRNAQQCLSNYFFILSTSIFHLFLITCPLFRYRSNFLHTFRTPPSLCLT